MISINQRTIIVDNEIAYECKKYPNMFITKTGVMYSIFVKGGQGKTDINNPRKVKCGQDRDGYYRMVYSRNGKHEYLKIHTVVVEQFIGDVPDGMVINHIDGNKHNNNITNLEITTVIENTRHAHRIGLCLRDTRTDVVYEGETYHFNSMADCCNYFPELSLTYLQELKYKKLRKNRFYFKKQNKNQKRSPIECYYNHTLFKIFDNMRSADDFFDYNYGATSAKIKSGQNKSYNLNKYYITFPNVSTIETPSERWNGVEYISVEIPDVEAKSA